MVVEIMPRGAAIKSITLPVENDHAPVVLGYFGRAEYESDAFFMGTTIGRVAGRIRHGRFSLKNQTKQVQTQTDQSGHCLHGGTDGLHAQNWALQQASQQSATFFYHSPHGQGGFPGALDVSVRYFLGNQMTLFIELEAQSDADTVVNLTNHAYFNLSGESTIDDHQVQIDASRFTPVDGEAIPTGEVLSVAGTPYDFSKPTKIGARLATMPGIDINYVLNHSESLLETPSEAPLYLAARLHSPISKVSMHVHTSQPCLQFYTGQFLRAPFHPRQGLCLEAQGYPDAPNQSAFPSIALLAGQRYKQVIAYDFSVEGGGA